MFVLYIPKIDETQMQYKLRNLSRNIIMSISLDPTKSIVKARENAKIHFKICAKLTIFVYAIKLKAFNLDFIINPWRESQIDVVKHRSGLV